MLKKTLTLTLFIILSFVGLISLAHSTTNQTSININSEAKILSRKAKNLNPAVLKLALRAYNSAEKQGIHITKPILTVIDYSLPSTTKRFWVLDLARQKVLFSSLVAHGKYSGRVYTTKFSDRSGSLESSLGLFLTENTYIGHRGYTLKIKGLEKGFNDKAEARRVVLHGAWYVTSKIAHSMGSIGRSWGCPAIEPQLAVPVINTIKNGTLIFAYYPNHIWLAKSKFLHYNA